MNEGSERPANRVKRYPAVRDVLAVAAAVALFVGMLWLLRGELGMTWDEPYFFERQHGIRDWLTQLFGTPRQRARALTREGLERTWLFCREVPNQHPPLPSLLSLVSGVTLEPLLGPLRAYRVSTVLLFALAAGVLFRLIRVRWGIAPALAAVGALVFNPRILADGQQCTADVDLAAFWLFAAAAYLHSCETRRTPWAFGVFAGLAIMCKAMGVVVLPATLLWALLVRPPGWRRPLIWAIPTVPATMLLINPAWWPAPVTGMLRWARAFLSYPQKVPIYYLGRVYDSVDTFLPWHNTAVMTATMVPVGLLLLTLLGLGALAVNLARARRNPTPVAEHLEPALLSDRAVAAWGAIHFLALLILRMFSFMPAHDGLRQLVPAFFFLPVLAAYAVRVVSSAGYPLVRRLGRASAALCIATAAWATVAIHPYELAYYNALIGGAKGAKARGMETTYFWDSANNDVLKWINANLPPGSILLIYPPPEVHTFAWEQHWGNLRTDLVVLNLAGTEYLTRLSMMFGEKPCFLLFQMRQGLYMPFRPGESKLYAHLAESPARFELAPARVDGVRLLAIFDQKEFDAVFTEEEKTGTVRRRGTR